MKNIRFTDLILGSIIVILLYAGMKLAFASTEDWERYGIEYSVTVAWMRIYSKGANDLLYEEPFYDMTDCEQSMDQYYQGGVEVYCVEGYHQ